MNKIMLFCYLNGKKFFYPFCQPHKDKTMADNKRFSLSGKSNGIASSSPTALSSAFTMETRDESIF